MKTALKFQQLGLDLLNYTDTNYTDTFITKKAVNTINHKRCSYN